MNKKTEDNDSSSENDDVDFQKTLNDLLQVRKRKISGKKAESSLGKVKVLKLVDVVKNGRKKPVSQSEKLCGVGKIVKSLTKKININEESAQSTFKAQGMSLVASKLIEESLEEFSEMYKLKKTKTSETRAEEIYSPSIASTENASPPGTPVIFSASDDTLIRSNANFRQTACASSLGRSPSFEGNQ